jgi:N-acyl-D-amino-acid deacylase
MLSRNSNLHAIVVMGFLFSSALAAVPTADTLIEGGLVYDGSDSPPRTTTVALRGDRIVGIGDGSWAGHPRRIDARGLVVSPGFIDLHNHSDMPDPGSPGRPALCNLRIRSNLGYLTQGVTTIVTGNCGSSPVDVAGFLASLEKLGVGTNVAHLLGHGDLREHVLGNANRAPTAQELATMQAIIARGMKDGAWGMSTGLYYTPGNFAKLSELVELSRVVARHGGMYASHIRDEGYHLEESVQEAIEIGRQSGAAVHISHLKADRPAVWGKGKAAVRLIKLARSRGQTVTADQYPYEGCSCSLADELIPPKYRGSARAEWVKSLDDPAVRAALKKDMEVILADYKGGSLITIANYEKEPSWQGKDLVTLARARKQDVFDLELEIERHGGAAAIYFSMGEEDIQYIMQQPFVATASDGHAQVPSANASHPRSFGTFPRKIGRIAMEQGKIPAGFAIRSATGLPADILRMRDRGYLRPGYMADVVVFDPSSFRDTATYLEPHRYSTGVQYLLVNGQFAIDRGRYTGRLPGRALRHAP